jgi:alpha-L-rhamnosidase
MRRRLYLTIIGFLFSCPVFSQEGPIIKEEFIFKQAPYKSCHASTIAETKSGLVAAWFGGTQEKHKDVEIWFSSNRMGVWSVPVSIADGVVETQRYPCWNPVLFYTGKGTLLLFYKVGPSPSEWWGMMKYSNDDGYTWSEGTRLPEGILGPIKNKPVMISENVLLCPSSTEHDGWKVHMERFHLNSNRWDMPVQVNYDSKFNVIQPTILKHPDGSLQALCRSRQGFIITSTSADQGKSWTAFKQTNLPNPNSGIDAVTLKNGKHILVYNHTGIPKGQWGGDRHPLNVAVSHDGRQWYAGIVLEDQESEYSYPAVIQSADGLVHILYTWKRLRIKHVVIDPDRLPENDMSIWE